MIDSFSNRLKIAMDDNNINLSKLSTITSISKPLISNYLSGNYKAKQQNIYKIAKALNVSPAWLMGFDVDMDREWFPESDNVIDEKTYKIYEDSFHDEIIEKYKIAKNYLTSDDKDTIIYILDKRINKDGENK